jgi:2-oxo-4-hydroxy-4-carboxy-5-ureidoimidazoline decarboxylase
MDVKQLNKFTRGALKAEMQKCCGSEKWADLMCEIFPVKDIESIFTNAELIWKHLGKNDWLEAFTHHPKIGDIDSLKKKFASTAAWASGEQSGVDNASESIISALAEGNHLYEEKFGFIFIVCATGKSAQEMLDLLQKRLPNNREEELLVAAEEQNKITKIRLEKLLNS